MVKAIDIYLQKVQKGEEIEPVELVDATTPQGGVHPHASSTSWPRRAARAVRPRNPVNKGRKPPAAMSRPTRYPAPKGSVRSGPCRRLFESGEKRLHLSRSATSGSPEPDDRAYRSRYSFPSPRSSTNGPTSATSCAAARRRPTACNKQILHRDGPKPVSLDLALIYSSKEIAAL